MRGPGVAQPLMTRQLATPSPHPPEAPVRAGMKACPITATDALFGRKWTFAILRDIVYFRRTRFHEFMDANPGLTARVLARRLRELVQEGILERKGSGRYVRYSLTRRGEDTKPILAAIYNYGIRNRPADVFKDARPRPLMRVLPEWDEKFIVGLFRLDQEPGEVPMPAGVGK